MEVWKVRPLNMEVHSTNYVGRYSSVDEFLKTLEDKPKESEMDEKYGIFFRKKYDKWPDGFQYWGLCGCSDKSPHAWWHSDSEAIKPWQDRDTTGEYLETFGRRFVGRNIEWAYWVKKCGDSYMAWRLETSSDDKSDWHIVDFFFGDWRDCSFSGLVQKMKNESRDKFLPTDGFINPYADQDKEWMGRSYIQGLCEHYKRLNEWIVEQGEKAVDENGNPLPATNPHWQPMELTAHNAALAMFDKPIKQGIFTNLEENKMSELRDKIFEAALIKAFPKAEDYALVKDMTPNMECFTLWLRIAPKKILEYAKELKAELDKEE